MGRFVRRLLVRGVLLLGLTSIGYYLWHGVTSDAADRWFGEAMVYMIIALNLITPVVVFAAFSTPRIEQLATQRRLFERLGNHELSEGVRLAQEWTHEADPMTHPLYHATAGFPVRITGVIDTRQSIRRNPVVRLVVRRRDTHGGVFEVVAVVPRIAIPRVGDVVRVIEHPEAPGRYQYAGPLTD